MAEDLKTNLAIKIRAARTRLRLTQEELAARIERTPESISNIERGLQLPSMETLMDLGRELKVPIAEFFEDSIERHGVSTERLKLEARLREIGRALSDRELEIAVQQANVFLSADLPPAHSPRTPQIRKRRMGL